MLYMRERKWTCHRVICRFASREQDKVDSAVRGRAKGRIQAIVDDAKARKKAGARLGRWTSRRGRPPSLKGKTPDGQEPGEMPPVTPENVPPRMPPIVGSEPEASIPELEATDEDCELDCWLENRRAQLGTTLERKL